MGVPPASPATCSVTTPPSAAGTHNIGASYSPTDGVHAASSDHTHFMPTVTARATSTDVQCTPGSVAVNQPTTCTATVTDTSGGGASAPQGTVTFSTSASGTDRKSGV